MSMKNILVGTVFGPTNRNREWLNLQHKFLKATVPTFDHISYLNEVHPKTFHRLPTEVIGHEPNPRGKSNIAHADALNKLLNAFKERRKNYQFFLFLDSDAFPIRKKWMEDLSAKMDSWTGKSSRKSRLIASAIRCENLETRLHSSILFCKPEALDHINFEVAENMKDLAGGPENDVWIGEYFQNKQRNLVLPMLRSNKANVHPVWSGVYHDMFYHHGGGSRPAKGRGHIHHDHYASIPDHIARYGNLMRSPCDYVIKLAGWNPKNYVRPEEIV